MKLKDLKIGASIIAPAQELNSEHEKSNLESLKNSFNKFIDEEIKEGHGEGLDKLKESFTKFLDEEMKE